MAIDRSKWDAQFGNGAKDPYDFTILMASFTYDARIGNGEQMVCLLSGVDEYDEPQEEMLTVGAGWESTDGGITIHNERKSATVNRSTNYGKWCSFAAEACEAVQAQWIFDADAKDARIWVGQKFSLTEKLTGEQFTNKQGEVVQARYRLMPDSYLGLDGAAVASVPAASAPSAPSPSAAVSASPAPSQAVPAGDAIPATAPVASPAPTTPGASRSIASQLAKQHDNYQSFINAALAMDAIATDDVLVTELLDGGDTGFYTLNHSN